ncbi:uncharacterized protein [Atheta coriaria]|uniref:uncharacterized protein isoform X2 n=1 Tax=Dalotia coriaria TaxID=877792 RepID=UPI0031F3F700
MTAWYRKLVIVFLTIVTSSASRIDDLVRRWSPLIWLAPGERFMPDSIEDFLPHTQPGDFYGKMMPEQNIIGGDNSTKLYLHTVNDIDELLSNASNSFLYGKDPSKVPVPVYALVTKCHEKIFHVTYWLFFPYSLGKEFCVLGNIPLPHVFSTCLGTKMLLGSHVGDYEHLSMSFDGNSSYPAQIYLGTHESGVYYTLNRKTRSFVYSEQIKRKFLAPKPLFPNEIRIKKKRIEVFASLGSHGLWAEPGNHSYHRFLGIEDISGYGTPWSTWQDLRIYHVDRDVDKFKREANVERGLPKWMFYEGKWGNPRSNCLIWRYFCGITDGPPGMLRSVKDFYCDKM